MKLNVTPRLNVDPVFWREIREHALQVNAMAEGRMAAFYTADTAAPTTGLYAKGDFLPNSDPQELGTAGSKYVIHGWRCVAGGEPGTWVQCRFLTGN